MKIAPDTIVTLLARIVTDGGQILNAGTEPFAYLQGRAAILPAIEQKLHDQEVGFCETFTLSTMESFGEYDESLKCTIDKKDFPPGIKVGGTIDLFHQGTNKRYRVIKIKGQKVLLDANQPLAGSALNVKLRVTEVRSASDDELAHGHAHGQHGHHH